MSAIIKQHDLFNVIPASVAEIDGLAYIPDYIDATSEDALISTIDVQPWITELKRRVQHYGWRYDYKARSVTNDLRIGALPDWLQSYAMRLQQAGLFADTPDQVIINEYEPGQTSATTKVLQHSSILFANIFSADYQNDVGENGV